VEDFGRLGLDLSNAKGRGNNACSLNEIALVLEDVG